MSSISPAGRDRSSSFWKLDGTRAILDAPRLRGEIELLHPARGLVGLLIDGAAQVGWLMGVDVSSTDVRGESSDRPWQIADAYVRGRDLVATYREPLEQPFDLQLYWRAADALDGAPALDLICSVQTPRWEAHPAVTVGSSMFDCAPAATDNALVVVGPNQQAYIEASRPGDFALEALGAETQSTGPHWRFGPQFMEKGVIRRLQLRGAFVPREEATRSISALQRDLAAEEPALTA